MTTKNDTSFTMAFRLEWLKSRLNSGDGFSIAEIMKEFTISDRTAKRYISMLRNKLKLELISKNKRYSLKTNIPIKQENLEDSQFQLFYAFVKKLGEEKVFSPLVTKFWLSEMNKKLPPKISDLSDKITYLLSESEESQPTIIKEIFKSFTNKRVLSISYQMPGRKPYREQIIPWQLVNHQGKWYLAAYSIAKDYTNYYRLKRIKEISITAEIFSEPSSKDVNDFIHNAFGIGGGRELHIAKIRFYPPVSKAIDEVIWHPEQEILDEKNCKIMKLPFGFKNELLGRILRYGQFAEILEPEDLRLEWLESIKEMSEKFL